MTKKHLVALVDAIATIDDDDQRFAVAQLIGEVCASFNDNFDWDIWFLVCEVSV